MGLHDDGVWDVKNTEKGNDTFTQYASFGTRTYKALPKTTSQLQPGVYSVNRDNNDGEPLFIRRDLKTDDIMLFKESLADEIFTEIDQFWTQRDKFVKGGFLHRRGYMLYGPQGTGKSSIVSQIIKDIVDRGGLVFTCDNPAFFAKGLTVFRQVEPNRPLVCIFEDIDAIIKRWGDSELLQVLDGDNQVDRVLNIATTNYPEMLDKRIISRPRRFDRIIKILAPSDAVRREYLKRKLPKGEKLEVWFKKTSGLSFAGLTEALISVTCLGNDLDATIEILKDIENGHASSEDFGTKNKLGFGTDDDDEDDDEFDVPVRPRFRTVE